MVKELTLQGKTYYLCPVCGTAYAERQWAERCEEFCTKYNACSVEITEHGVALPQMEESLAR